MNSEKSPIEGLSESTEDDVKSYILEQNEEIYSNPNTSLFQSFKDSFKPALKDDMDTEFTNIEAQNIEKQKTN
ncbi:unnamed protein product [Hanseniaspora opuntiae]